MIEVAERFVYPVKSLGAYQLADHEEMVIGPEGVEGSRRWIVTDTNGNPVTARTPRFSKMLGIHPVPAGGDDFILDESLLVKADEVERYEELELFKDRMAGRKHYRGSKYLSDMLGEKVFLLHYDEAFGRRVHPEKLWKGTEPRAFVDGAQITICSLETGADLQTRWPDFDADSRRVRPDFTVRGTNPYAEFVWVSLGASVQIGDVILGAQRPMDRCPMPNIHPDTLERTKTFSQMIAKELMLEIPDPATPALQACYSIGLKVVEQGVINAGAEVTVTPS